ncbi:hypothetical protein F7R02_25290 [Xanthomonas cissicola]|nr:hypothetical protein F7R02_25290 [Xanthomonas cissicola]
MDEAKAVAAGYGERAPVNQEIPTESARNGEIPKIQTPLFGTTRHPALSGLVIQTFPRRGMIRRPGASGIVSRRGDCYTSYRALLSSRTPATTFQSTEFIALLPRRYARYGSYPEKWQVRK